MLSAFQARVAAKAIEAGNVIAYPTEAVFGLGCDTLNFQAVSGLLEIKERTVEKGLILIASDFSQLRPYVKSVDPEVIQPALESWPGPNTWIFPARENTPYWLTGKFTGIAVRITAHPVVRQLCDAVNMPLVSTSANHSGQQPARSLLECRLRCPEADLFINGQVNRQAKPSTIRDLLSGSVIRS